MPASSLSNSLQEILASLEADAGLWGDFLALCDCGGRRAGSGSERAALQFLRGKFPFREERVRYAGWQVEEARLVLDGAELACHALLGSASGRLTAEVLDLGRGTQEDFGREAARIAGRIVLVRHEYPFSPTHIHRRRKLGWATERGAAGFVIAHPEPGRGPVSGSSGRGGGIGIPAVATDFESAKRMADRRVDLKVNGKDQEAQTSVLILDIPGKTAQWIALSAHLDGHDLAESALDNATGVAAVLAIARALAPHVAACERGLRVCLFSAEEWALAGSRQYLDAMPVAERNSIAMNINLDTVAGDPRLTALTSEFPALDAFVREQGIDTYLPMMANSDHFNFARHGIPALRLVAGFDRPQSNVRHILTRGDTRDKAMQDELRNATRVAATLAWRALTRLPSQPPELWNTASTLLPSGSSRNAA